MKSGRASKAPPLPPAPSLYSQWLRSGGYYFENYLGPGAVPLIVSVDMNKLPLKHGKLRQTDVFLLVDGRRVDWRQMSDVPMDKYGVAIQKADRLMLSLRPGVHEVVCQPISAGKYLSLFSGEPYGAVPPEEWQTDHVYKAGGKFPRAFSPVTRGKHEVNPGSALHVVVWSGPDLLRTREVWGIERDEARVRIIPAKLTTVRPVNVLKVMQSFAAKKLPGALYDLGYRHLHGIGVPRDSWKARELLKAAAEAGHVGARKSLGDMLRASGTYVLAASWYTGAFDKGLVHAGVAMRRLYTVHAPDSARRQLWADRVREKGEPRPGWRASELANLGRPQAERR